MKVIQPHQWTNAEGEVLILKRINKDRTAYGGFTYPQGIGSVVVPETWNPKNDCGHGIHGWPWGFGIGDGSDFSIIDDIWLVVSAKPADVIGELNNGLKCKAREVKIRFEGSFKDAWAVVASAQKEIIDNLAAAGKSADDSNLAASGNGSKLAASGYGSKLAASGNDSKLAASGYGSNLAASGNGSKLAASGYGSKLAASGNDSNLAASGNDSKLAASGNDSKLAASGYGSNLAASGNDSNLAASGYGSKLAASGNDSKLAASGYGSNLAASGNDSNLAASGYGSKLAASGENSVCAIAALGGRVKVGKGGAFALAHWTESNGWSFKTGKEGEDGIKADVWYEVRNGRVVKSEYQE
jgi:hypothetical protein